MSSQQGSHHPQIPTVTATTCQISDKSFFFRVVAPSSDPNGHCYAPQCWSSGPTGDEESHHPQIPTVTATLPHFRQAKHRTKPHVCERVCFPRCFWGWFRVGSRNYWGELAIWSERRIGELILESKADGTIKQGRPESKGDIVSPLSLLDLLGTETDTEAKQISSRSQRLASHTVEAVEEAIEAIKQPPQTSPNAFRC